MFCEDISRVKIQKIRFWNKNKSLTLRPRDLYPIAYAGPQTLIQIGRTLELNFTNEKRINYLELQKFIYPRYDVNLRPILISAFLTISIVLLFMNRFFISKEIVTES